MIGGLNWVSPDVRLGLLTWSTHAKTKMGEASSLAINLFYLAFKTKDRRALIEARKYYTVASQLLRGHLDKSNDTEMLVAAASKLKHCTMFNDVGIRIDKDHFWNSYVKAIASLIREAVHRQTDNTMSRNHFRWFRRFTLVQSLILRGPVIDSGLRQMCSDNNSHTVGQNFMSIALQIPDMLAGVYGASEGTSPLGLSGLLNDLEA